MIEIKKGKEPPELTKHRKSEYATYANMPRQTHQAVIDSLLREQGYICAYCMRRIPQKGKDPSVTIEHIDAQSKSNDSKALDYRNMVAVCNGNRGNPEARLTCDARRNNAVLLVNPLVGLTLTSIQYRANGTIYSDNPEIHRDLNDRLNLNCIAVGLVDSRRAALQRMLIELQGKHPAGDIKLYCKRLLEKYEQDTTKTPYVGILIWWLKKHC